MDFHALEKRLSLTGLSPRTPRREPSDARSSHVLLQTLSLGFFNISFPTAHVLFLGVLVSLSPNASLPPLCVLQNRSAS